MDANDLLALRDDAAVEAGWPGPAADRARHLPYAGAAANRNLLQPGRGFPGDTFALARLLAFQLTY